MENAPEIQSHGCRLNAAEGEVMRGLAQDAGLGRVVVVNSCAVTNDAVRRARQAVRRARRADPDVRIVVTGCAAQIAPTEFETMNEVDVVLGNQEKLDPAQWRALSEDSAPQVRVNDIMSVRETAGHLIDGYGDRARAFLQIQNGCDHRCTFCIIPFGRGPSRSVPVPHIVDQARRLVDAGHNELVLTGVDITSYGADLDGAPTLGALVGALLDAIPDLFRLRLSSVDGAEIDEALFDRIAGDARVAPHVHLSLQSGDDLILKRMKRRHTRAGAIRLCQELRAHRPEIAFGADLIAGFPTETEAAFKNSLAIVDEAGLSFLHVFPFSPREGTPAARMPQLPRDVVKSRAAQLRAKGDMALISFLDGIIGRTEEAIVESGGRARLANFASVAFDAQGCRPGEVARVKILGREGDLLRGAIATADVLGAAPALSENA
ncbi:MAG: tRNA (N(6)-L-threonylcarbamoyladenosine(37)-C(2))-methylthiotransferase MtaB [Pseudomonadota bacterium]